MVLSGNSNAKNRDHPFSLLHFLSMTRPNPLIFFHLSGLPTRPDSHRMFAGDGLHVCVSLSVCLSVSVSVSVSTCAHNESVIAFDVRDIAFDCVNVIRVHGFIRWEGGSVRLIIRCYM